MIPGFTGDESLNGHSRYLNFQKAKQSPTGIFPADACDDAFEEYVRQEHVRLRNAETDGLALAIRILPPEITLDEARFFSPQVRAACQNRGTNRGEWSAFPRGRLPIML